jgi:hypothetical protein
LFDIICDLQRNPIARSASKPFRWRTKMIGSRIGGFIEGISRNANPVINKKDDAIGW